MISIPSLVALCFCFLLVFLWLFFLLFFSFSSSFYFNCSGDYIKFYFIILCPFSKFSVFLIIVPLFVLYLILFVFVPSFRFVSSVFHLVFVSWLCLVFLHSTLLFYWIFFSLSSISSILSSYILGLFVISFFFCAR